MSHWRKAELMRSASRGAVLSCAALNSSIWGYVAGYGVLLSAALFFMLLIIGFLGS